MREFPALFLYVIFFFCLFLQFPINGALSGNCDTWLGIALSNTYLNELKALFLPGVIGSGMYPAADVHPFGETAIIPASLFVFWKLLGLDDVNAHFLYITLIFSLSSFGVYLLTNLLTENRLAAFFSGFAFGCSNFMFANIDDSIVLFFFFPALSLYFFFKYVRFANPRDLYFAAIAGGLESYCSLYVYTYQTLILAVAIVFYGRSLLSDKKYKVFLTAVSIYCCISALYFLYYIYALGSYNYAGFNPSGMELKFFKLFSLSGEDVLATLPSNILYQGKEIVTGNFSFFIDVRTRAFVGYLVVLLALFSFCKPTKEKLFFLMVGILGLMLSWGEITLGDYVIHPPIYYLNKIFPLMEYLRVVFRFYFLTLFAIAVLSGYGIALLITRLMPMRNYAASLTVLAFLIVHALENIAFPLPTFAARSYTSLPESYLDFFPADKTYTLAEVPSSSKYIQFVDLDKDINPYNREFIYLNLQTKHNQNTVNGLNGYYPQERIEIQKALDAVPEKNALQKLFEAGVTHLVLHKKLLMPDENGLPAKLFASPYLNNVHSKDEIVVFTMSLPQSDKPKLLMGNNSEAEQSGAVIQ